jgi:signal transduction histidine kinase/CheY-like chemotaxis protein
MWLDSRMNRERADEPSAVAGAAGGASFVLGGGANGGLVRAMDWKSFPVGPAADWPQSLRTALDICLNSRFPMALYWGSQFAMLYNDDLVPMVGAKKHPWALGRPAQEVLPEIWDIIGPLLQSVVDSGEAIWLEDLMLPMQRAEAQEEGYFTFTYSPIRDETGAVGGVLCAVVETTEKTIEERRLRLLNNLAGAIQAKTPAEACAFAAAQVASATSDVPFALFYMLDQSSGVAQLVGNANIECGTVWSPLSIPLVDRSVWPLQHACASDEAKVVLLENGPVGTRGAVILRIERAGGGMPFGFIVAGLSTLLGGSESYARFHRLLAAAVSQSTMNAATRFAEREANQRLHSLFAEAPVSVAVMRGPEFVFDLVNPRYEQMVGRTGILGKSFQAAFPELPDDAPVLGMFAEVRRSGVPFVANEYALPLDRTSSGKLEEACFMFTCQPIREADGSVDTLLVIAVDVTEPVRLRRELEKLALRERIARGQAEAASALKDEFLSTASHELRTPLNAILGWARLLSAGDIERSSFERGMETIERNALAQVRLIEDILDGSRIITGKLRLDVRPLDLTTLLQAAIDVIRPAADAKQIAIRVTADPAAARMQGDPDRLQQVIWNLLNNAIKFTPKAGAVEVRLTRVDTSIELCVTDTGEGIGADFLPYVFERFRQADGSSTRRHGGLGLGLALVRHLVEAHGGTVRAKSEGVGRGSEFTVMLPVQAVFQESQISERPPTMAVQSTPLLATLDGVSALVVDDEADARELVALVLRAAGAEVVTASNADEASDLVANSHFDILISDIGMPNADGYELMRRVRSPNGSRNAGLPVIALTAYAREQDRNRALEAGFQTHVSKPVEPSELVRVAVELVQLTRA